MRFQPDPNIIRWRLHLAAPVQKVFRMLSTDGGRAQFWAESAVETDGFIHFQFINGAEWRGRVLQNVPDRLYQLEYYGGSIAAFELSESETGGTELILADRGVPAEDRAEVIAGWVSVLLALKAAVDFGVDLRNHHPHRNWDQGYAEN